MSSSKKSDLVRPLLGGVSGPVGRRSVLKGLGAGLGAAALGGLPAAAAAGDEPLNVLFISIDDLNDWVGVLGGHKQALTPHLDELAGRSVSFENAHCAAPACNPSRTATHDRACGPRTRPGSTTTTRPGEGQMPDVQTLPQVFAPQRLHGP